MRAGARKFWQRWYGTRGSSRKVDIAHDHGSEEAVSLEWATANPSW